MKGRCPTGRVWKAQDLWNSSATVVVKKVTVGKTAQIPHSQAVQEDYEVVLNDVPAHGIQILKLTGQVRPHLLRLFSRFDDGFADNF
ncbi:hypothetical protein O181_050162 [Austropuccinia psidii MF-1]|uniref:Uncharacterized protein n=1 Tax=Austropuccinia psidii MF-1 TaxID=1389203 RepID=A0A9Q3HNB7_9BASI|nr:hypothetical protein [Austropuccinia psidii MF-1]